VTRRDHLAEVIFVAVPPWGPDDRSFAAFDRSGNRRTLEIIDASPPGQSLTD